MRWPTWNNRCLVEVGFGVLRRADAAVRRPYLTTHQIARLISQEILKSPAAVSRESPRTGIDKISEQDAIARLHFRSNRVGGMPGIVSYRKRIAAVRREWHLRFLWFFAVWKHFVKYRADMRCRIVRGQVELYGDSLPQAVSVL